MSSKRVVVQGIVKLKEGADLNVMKGRMDKLWKKFESEDSGLCRGYLSLDYATREIFEVIEFYDVESMKFHWKILRENLALVMESFADVESNKVVVHMRDEDENNMPNEVKDMIAMFNARIVKPIVRVVRADEEKNNNNNNNDNNSSSF